MLILHNRCLCNEQERKAKRRFNQVPPWVISAGKVIINLCLVRIPKVENYSLPKETYLIGSLSHATVRLLRTVLAVESRCSSSQRCETPVLASTSETENSSMIGCGCYPPTNQTLGVSEQPHHNASLSESSPKEKL